MGKLRELYACVVVWQKPLQGGGLNIAHTMLLTIARNKQEALGRAIEEGQQSYPSHLMGHKSVTQVSRILINVMREHWTQEYAEFSDDE